MTSIHSFIHQLQDDWRLRREQHLRLMVTIFVGLSLCVYFFFLMLPMVTLRKFPTDEGNSYWFTRLSQQPLKHELNRDYEKQLPVFVARPAAQFLAGKVWDMPRDPQMWYHFRFQPLAISFGLYNSFWLGLLFGLLIHYRRNDAVFLMFGIFTGLMYNMNQPAGSWWLPWDMPIMCLFTWSILVFQKNEYFPLVLLVFTASLFKETGLVCALLVLLGPWSWTKRWLGFAGLVLAFVLCRKFLIAASGATTILVPLNEATDGASLFHNAMEELKLNLSDLFSFHLNSPLFANCGMWFVMFILPGRPAVKIMAAVFMAGQFIAGTVFEFRDFFELLPLGLMQLSDYLSNRNPSSPSIRHGNPANLINDAKMTIV